LDNLLDGAVLADGETTVREHVLARADRFAADVWPLLGDKAAGGSNGQGQGQGQEQRGLGVG